MLVVGYNCLCAYQLMIQRMRDKLDQVQQELKANCDRERDKLVYRLVHSGQQMREKVYFYCFCLKIRSCVHESNLLAFDNYQAIWYDEGTIVPVWYGFVCTFEG